MPEVTGIERLRQVALQSLSGRAAGNRLRTLVPQISPGALPDSPLRTDLSHNDYLSLRQDPDFQTVCRQSISDLPPGSGGSRLLGGESPEYQRLEMDFARFKGAESALFFPSGYQANISVAQALGTLEDTAVFSDAANHASIIDGIRLSGIPAHHRHIYRHLDTGHLDTLLASSTAEVKVVITESIFSMDGDQPDVAALSHVVARHGATLIVDEAHAVFVSGAEGRGLFSAPGTAPEQIISVNTCGKAMGTAGALVAGPTWFRDLLINNGRTFIYTTGASPWLAAATRASLHYNSMLDGRRQRLAKLAAQTRRIVNDLGFSTGSGTSQIIPVILGSDQSAIQASAIMRDHGILARAIRYPTVAAGTERLRISLHAGLQDDDLQRLQRALGDIRKNFPGL